MRHLLLTGYALLAVCGAGCHLIFPYQDNLPDAGGVDLSVKKDGPVAKKDGPVAKKDGPVATKDGPVATKDGPVATKDGPLKDLATKLDMSCPTGQTLCAGKCVDISSDVNNCGKCGVSCNDGLACTNDSCSGAIPRCSYKIAGAKCLINGKCYDKDKVQGTCLKCVPATSPTAWTNFGGPGCVYTLSGQAGTGVQDGILTKAQFKSPHGIAVASNGTIYISDSGNHKIRRIVGDKVATLAGGTKGFQDGVGVSARFNKPTGLALDAAGNIFVTDSGNSRIRRVSPSGKVTTLGPAGVLKNPEGLTVTVSGDIYVADTGNHVIRKLTPGGSSLTLVAGKPQVAALKDDIGSAARFNQPADILVGHGTGLGTSPLHLVVADRGNHCLRKIAITNKTYVNVTRIAGSGSQGNTGGANPTGAQFNAPHGLVGVKLSSSGALSSSNGWVVDTKNHAIRGLNNSYVSVAAGGNGPFKAGTADGAATTVARFNNPTKAATLGKQIFITDGVSHRIRVLVLP